MSAKTKIIATVGPASNSTKTLQKLLDNGASVFRLNMSHGGRAEHRKTIRQIRRLSCKPGQIPGILMDLQGPKIRVGSLPNPLRLAKGAKVAIVSSQRAVAPETIPTTYKGLARDVRVRSRILLDDGKMELRVVSKRKSNVLCKVIRGGWLQSNKGINLPNVTVNSPSLTTKDRADLEFGIAERVDFVALSFVRRERDLQAVRKVLSKHKSGIPVIAKIEKPEAILHLPGILRRADGVMVARGDLGVEMSSESVPVLQKEIIHMANRMGRFVVTATQMLETMVENTIPTRAEASDVANAVFDGTDALMLSGETAVGKHPTVCVSTMRSIAARAQRSGFHYRTSGDLDAQTGYLPHAMAEAAFHTAKEIGNATIVVFSLSGATAFYMSKLRPSAPIIALTPSSAVCRRLSIAWGVLALQSPFGRNADEMIAKGEKALLKSGLMRKGQRVVVVAGATPSKGGTNMMKVHQLG